MMGIEVRLLGYTSPFRVEEDERRKGIWIGQLEYPVAVGEPSVMAVYNNGDWEEHYCWTISSGNLANADGVPA
jgi:hypothetical protein